MSSGLITKVSLKKQYEEIFCIQFSYSHVPDNIKQKHDSENQRIEIHKEGPLPRTRNNIYISRYFT